MAIVFTDDYHCRGHNSGLEIYCKRQKPVDKPLMVTWTNLPLNLKVAISNITVAIVTTISS